MFHTNKMPKIIVFRVVIEGTAPTEGPPTACHRKRPSCPKRAHARLPIQPWEAPFLSRAPRAPAFSSGPERPSVRIQLPHLRKPFSGAYLRPSVQARETPFLSQAPQRPPSRLSPNAPAPASSFPTCESHFRAHICARLQFQAAPPMSRLQLQAACLCQPAWSACVSP